jgi:hypothetical protein
MAPPSAIRSGSVMFVVQLLSRPVSWLAGWIVSCGDACFPVRIDGPCFWSKKNPLWMDHQNDNSYEDYFCQPASSLLSFFLVSCVPLVRKFGIVLGEGRCLISVLFFNNISRDAFAMTDGDDMEC